MNDNLLDSLRLLISWHLNNNFTPPMPEYSDVLLEAIINCHDDKSDALVTTPLGKQVASGNIVLILRVEEIIKRMEEE